MRFRRFRIGVISPTVFERIPIDFYSIAPPGVTMVGVTCNMGGWKSGEYRRALKQVDDSAKYLGERDVDYIIHVGAPLVVAQGFGFDRKIIARIKKASGRPCTTTIRAAISAFETLRVRKPLVLTPFHDKLNGQLRDFLERNGISVAKLVVAPSEFNFLQDVPAQMLYRTVVGAARTAPAFDSIYIPSGQLAATEAVLSLEGKLGVPCIAQGHSDFWAAFKNLKIRDIKPGHGRLLDTLRQ